jgi:DNA repair exonuclease SbcCD ATPase subunit
LRFPVRKSALLPLDPRSMPQTAMIDTLPPPQVEQRALPRTPDEKKRNAGATIGILATCFVLAIALAILATRIHKQNVLLAEMGTQLALSNSRATAIQADLDSAKARASALQAQVADGQSQRTDLQSQLDRAKALAAGLQAQNAKDQGVRSGLQAQLENANAQIASLQAQLAGSQGQRADLQSRLDSARAQSADLQAQLGTAQGDLTKLHPLIVKARQMPLTATFEKSFWDYGFTLHLSNPGTEALKVRITISGSEKTRYEATEIEGGSTVSIGRLPPGEKVVIAGEGYDPLSLTAQ